MLVRRVLVIGRGAAAATLAEDLGRASGLAVIAAAGDEADLVRLFSGHELVASAAAGADAPAVLQRALEAGCGVADLGAPLPETSQLDGLARSKQVVACVRCADLAQLIGAPPGERAAALLTAALARRLLTGDFRPHWGIWTPGRLAARPGMRHGLREDLRERGLV